METAEFAHPILNCSAAADHEARILGSSDAVWRAMREAGDGVADAVLRDFHEIAEPPEDLRVLVLAGKGNNGGDALIAAARILERYPRGSLVLACSARPDAMGEGCRRAHDRLQGDFEEVEVPAAADADSLLAALKTAGGRRGFDICIDGLLGMSFRPPLRDPAGALVDAVNRYPAIRLRAAVDLPSGLGDERDALAFRADFTYATGVFKAPLLLHHPEAGRVRYIDLGFFASGGLALSSTGGRVLTPSVLGPLRALRPASSDKRDYGHLFVVGGSAGMPGALLMTVMAAVRSGAGRVTAFAPASVVPNLAARVPEAMWVPWPETAGGALNPSFDRLLFDRIGDADALLAGPGMGRDRASEMLCQEIVRRVEQPLVFDADALQRRVLELAAKRGASMGALVVTPHFGEFERIARQPPGDDPDAAVAEFSRVHRVITVLKGPLPRVSDGQACWVSPFGGPVLARGGSGDLLSGMVAATLAGGAVKPLEGAACATVWHGLAGDALARRRGQVAVRTTELLDHLAPVLRAPAGLP